MARALCILLLTSFLAPARPAPEWLEAVGQLESEDFREREAAHARLLRAGQSDTDALLAMLVEQLKKRPPIETRLRLEMVMRQTVLEQIYARPRGYLGIQMMKRKSLYDRRVVHVIWVHSVTEAGPADRAGLRSEDEILEVNGKRFAEDASNETFRRQLQMKRPGDKVRLTLLRNDRPRELEVVLGEAPPNLQRGEHTRLDFDQFFEKWREEAFAEAL